jgi:hypothetical protein
MPTQCSRDLFGYEVVESRQVVVAFDGGNATSDAGGLLLGATDRAIGLVAQFAVGAAPAWSATACRSRLTPSTI